jgi:hypothetical protein
MGRSPESYLPKKMKKGNITAIYALQTIHHKSNSPQTIKETKLTTE